MSLEETRKNHTCLSCQRVIDSRDLASMQCGHPYHYQCLQISLKQQIQNAQYPVCCPVTNCLIEPSMYFMSVVLEESDFKSYLILEKNSIQQFHNYECPVCDQSFMAYPSNQYHKCLKCYKIICLECKSLSHPGKKCQKKQLLTDKEIIDQLPQLKTPTNLKNQISQNTSVDIRSHSVSKRNESEQGKTKSDSNDLKGSTLFSSSSNTNRPNSLNKYSTASTASNSGIPSLTNINQHSIKKGSLIDENMNYSSATQNLRARNIFQPLNQQIKPLLKDIEVLLRDNQYSIPNFCNSNNALNIQINNNENKHLDALNQLKKQSKILLQKNSC
ncbi:hypothetical protein ABPG72_001555 [Tetrahymena utriculariae]